MSDESALRFTPTSDLIFSKGISSHLFDLQGNVCLSIQSLQFFSNRQRRLRSRALHAHKCRQCGKDTNSDVERKAFLVCDECVFGSLENQCCCMTPRP